MANSDFETPDKNRMAHRTDIPDDKLNRSTADSQRGSRRLEQDAKSRENQAYVNGILAAILFAVVLVAIFFISYYETASPPSNTVPANPPVVKQQMATPAAVTTTNPATTPAANTAPANANLP